MRKCEALKLALEWDFLLWRCERIADGSHADGDPVRLRKAADDIELRIRDGGWDVCEFIPQRASMFPPTNDSALLRQADKGAT